MAKTISVDLGSNVTLLVRHSNDSVEVRADYSINCDEISGEVHKSMNITLPPGLEVQQKNIIKNFVIPQIESAEGLKEYSIGLM